MDIQSAGAAPAVSLAVYGAMAPRKAIETAGGTGFRAVGIPACVRDFSPRRLGESGLRDLGAFLSKNGLSVSWLSAGPRGRFTLGATLQEDVDTLLALLAMAASLRAGAVVTAVGPLGAEGSGAAGNAAEALRALAEAADAVGVQLALRSAAGEDDSLGPLLRKLSGAPVGLVFDPGELLFAGRDPVDAAAAYGVISAVRASDSNAEEKDLPPGEGRVPWRDVLAALSVRDYYGHLTVDFAARTQSVEAAAAALSVLRRASA